MINTINKIKQNKEKEKNRGAVFDRGSEKASLKRLHLSTDFSESKREGCEEQRRRRKGRRKRKIWGKSITSQALGTGNSKALRQNCVWGD